MSNSTGPEDGHGDRPDSGAPVTLSALAASGILLEWHEATAVVQAVCALLGKPESAASDSVPDQDHVLIHPDGQLSIARGSPATGRSAGEQASALAQLLLSLVSDSQMPVQLRLVVLSAISPTPPFGRLSDFSNALAYFERPERAAVIRGVYLRWHTRPSVTVPLGPPQPTPAPAKQPALSSRPHPRVRKLAITAAIVTVLVSSAAGVWWASGRPEAAPLISASRTVTKVFTLGWAAARDWVAQNVSALRSRFEAAPGSEGIDQRTDAPRAGTGATRSEPPGRGGARRAEASAGRQSVEAGGLAAPAPSATELPPIRAFDLGAMVPRLAPGAIEPLTALPVSPPSAPGVMKGGAPAPGSAGPVYTSADQDVLPPVPVKPKIATVLPAGEREENLSVVDLVIGDDGQVETVKLVRPARGVRAFMMLSAAKAWRFEPALKDGRPVRYLKRIWISLSPIGTLER